MIYYLMKYPHNYGISLVLPMVLTDLIGIIKINDITKWNNYRYFNETRYMTHDLFESLANSGEL